MLHAYIYTKSEVNQLLN